MVMAQTIHKMAETQPNDLLAKFHKRLDELEALRDSTGGLPTDLQEEEQKLLKDLNKRARQGDTLSFEPVSPREIEDKYSILIFDEASMIGRDKTYAHLIAPIRLPRIFIGDSAQLPPVKDEPAVDFTKTNVHLTEILRQGKDSGILKYAHQLHKGRVPSAASMSSHADVEIIKNGAISTIKGHEDAQFIVWMNKERHAIAPRLRKALGFNYEKQKFPWLPMEGEKLYIDDNSEELRLSRGDVVTVRAIWRYAYQAGARLDARSNNPYLCGLTIDDRQGRTRDIVISLSDMVPEQLCEREVDDKRLRRFADYTKGNYRVKALWASVITCHRAQGSEYDKVFMLGTMMPKGHKDWQKWWYTAATRAKKKLIVASYHYMHED
jgi:hypothetical protein